MENEPCTPLTDSDVIKISIATTPEEKKEIYRLRYTIYAEEIGYDLVGADHKNKLLYDELDEWGTLFYAKIGSEVVGTVRVNIGQLSSFPSEIVKMYSMDKFKEYYHKDENYSFGIASKGMVASSYRNFPLFTTLMTKVFEMYCDNQVDFGFGSTNFYLLPLHEHYGHRRIGTNVVDPSYGALANFVVMPNDIDHLRRVHSPFLKIALDKGKTQNNRFIEWFRSRFPGAATITNSQLVTEEIFWEILRTRLGYAPNKCIPILQGLSEADAKKFLYRCGVIVQCSKGDYVVARESVSQEIIVLLSGTLHSPDSLDIDKIPLGQHLNGNGLINRTRHTLSIVAATDTEILVLSYHFFLKFNHLYPDIASKIVKNINFIGASCT